MCLMEIFLQGLDTTFLLHYYCTVFMTGLIWTIQLVHYPSFGFVKEERYREFQHFHMRRITYIVGPLMILEVLTGALIMFKNYQNTPYVIAAILLALIWLNTAFLNVPIHNQLMSKGDEGLFKKLVLSNWPRTILWTVRSLILTYIYLTNSLNS